MKLLSDCYLTLIVAVAGMVFIYGFAAMLAELVFSLKHGRRRG